MLTPQRRPLGIALNTVTLLLLPEQGGEALTKTPFRRPRRGREPNSFCFLLKQKENLDRLLKKTSLNPPRIRDTSRRRRSGTMLGATLVKLPHKLPLTKSSLSLPLSSSPVGFLRSRQQQKITTKAPELHTEFHRQMVNQQVVAGVCTYSKYVFTSCSIKKNNNLVLSLNYHLLPSSLLNHSLRLPVTSLLSAAQSATKPAHRFYLCCKNQSQLLQEASYSPSALLFCPFPSVQHFLLLSAFSTAFSLSSQPTRFVFHLLPKQPFFFSFYHYRLPSFTNFCCSSRPFTCCPVLPISASSFSCFFFSFLSVHSSSKLGIPTTHLFLVLFLLPSWLSGFTSALIMKNSDLAHAMCSIQTHLEFQFPVIQKSFQQANMQFASIEITLQQF
ncbi:hypothetical protein MA16_Dca021441 [Dendrobium catenatum]|uniref:Uncharacterized protein n=1 Tax=Dendrobium catenatum TaxID=906689 RepID=A0A2I0WBW7_9ASPA|nr:hypothetical protein MA16_Dca021441 [Dendrobium catenatum]